MAKVHPHLLSSLSSSFSSSSSSSLSSSFSRFEERSINYTVWMKSLVFNGNGCTIFDANGNVVYRVDNYDSKSCTQVFLMDLKGRVLSTLLKKKLRVNEHWNGYKNDRVNKEKAWFQVKKKSKLFSKGDGFSCQVKIRGDDCEALSCFKIQGSCKKSEFKIVRGDGLMVAQVKRKQSKQGVLLGDDVLSLEIEPNLDHSFIISLVLVHGLMSHKM